MHPGLYHVKPTITAFDTLLHLSLTQMVHAGLIDKAALELILKVTDRCRDYIERHFHLSQQLYFAYTHLVCRTAKPGELACASCIFVSYFYVFITGCLVFAHCLFRLFLSHRKLITSVFSFLHPYFSLPFFIPCQN